LSNPEQIVPEDFELIEIYLLRRMNAEEMVAFENRLVTDADFRAQFNEQKLIYEGINEAALKQKMDGYHGNLRSKKPSRTIQLFSRKWLAAAAVLLIAGCIWWLTLGNKAQRLYVRYYKPDPGLISIMGTSDNYDFDRAMVDYKTGNYEAAISIWKKQLQTKPANDTLKYFLGVALLGKQEAKQSIDYLQKVATQEKSFFHNDAQWYTGLAYLKLGRKTEAIEFIRKSGHPGSEEILVQLGKK